MLTPDVVAADPKLADVALLRTEWMNGLMFYLRERVDVTKGHVSYVDSGWAITSISEAQFWKRSLRSYGDGTVKDCLSAIISDWTTAGNFNRRSARDCTPEEIAREAWAQIKAHLNDTGTVLTDDMLHSWFLDPSIIAPPGTPPEVRNDEPLFIQHAGSWARRPEAVTGIDNLFLAGEWVKTDQNVTTMEGANEGGRYAANGVLQASVFFAVRWSRSSNCSRHLGGYHSNRPTGRATARSCRTRWKSSTPAGHSASDVHESAGASAVVRQRLRVR